MVGEHGDSEVLTWSIVDVGGLPLQECARLLDIPLGKKVRQRIDDEVRNAAYEIIEGKGATYYGVGSALAHLVEIVGHDHRGLLTVCSPLAEVQGMQDVTLSVPHLLDGEGSLATLPLRLSHEENEGLRRSARVIRDAIAAYDASR